MTPTRIAVVMACFAIAALPAGAQTVADQPAAASRAAAAKASDAASSASTYRSAFEGFRRFADQPVGSWREANDTVGRVGGWRAYAREAQGGARGPTATAACGCSPSSAAPPVQPAASSPGPAAAPAAGHAGHGSK